MRSDYLQEQKKEKLFTRENHEFFLLFITSALFVYFAPVVVTRIYFLIILFLYYRSKNNYFWIAMMFIFLSAPAGFFSGGLASDTQRLPIYTILTGFSFSFFDLFFIVSIIKVLLRKNVHLSFYFNKSLIAIILFGCMLLIYSLALGMDFSGIILTMRTFLLPFLFFLLAPRLMPDATSFIKIFKLILPFVVLSFIGQIYEISYGKYLISIFKPGIETIASSGAAIMEGSEDVARFFDAEYLNTISIIFCSFFIIKGIRVFKPFILIILIFLNYIICYTSATRGPFLTYSIILMALLLFLFRSSLRRKNYLKYIVLFPIVVLFGLMTIKSNQVMSIQLERSSERLTSVEYLITGRGKSRIENPRLEQRIPLLIKKFKESPIIGWGFSEEGIKAQDGHVGFHNMLREGGVFEMVVFLFWFFQIAKFPISLSNKRGISINEKFALLFMSIVLLALMIKHATSSQLFGYLVEFDAIQKWFMISVMLTGFNVFYWQIKSDMTNRLKKEKVIYNKHLRF